MTQFNYPNGLLFSIAVIVVLIASSCQQAPTLPEKPNFLFIIVDDLGAHDLSCTGSTFYETPNIDRISQAGLNFSNAYATCAVCSPSRASIMSGRFPARHGITDYIGARTGEDWKAVQRHTKLLPPDYQPHLPHQYVTLPEAMKFGGYTTFFAGKWHLGSKDQYSLPTHHGFDFNQGGYHQGGPYSGGFFSPFNNPVMKDYPEEKGMSLSMKLANETNKFIEANQDTSFFAMLSFYAVHAPIQTTEARWRKYRDKAEKLGIEDQGFEMERVLPIRKHQDNPVYAGLVEQVDEAIGVVLDKLAALGLQENTVIVFTSDNGGVASGDHYATSNAPLRGGKGYQWEGGLRVPSMIHVPWLHHQGIINHSPISGADWYPTVVQLANLPLREKEHLDGHSLLPILQGGSIEERPLYWHYPHYGNQGGEPHAIIRQGDWKLIHYWEDNRNELYNLATELSEQNNIAKDHSARVEQMETQLLSWLKSVDASYARVDSTQDVKAANLVLEQNRTSLKIGLENQRKQMFAIDWQPNEDWWGSQISKE